MHSTNQNSSHKLLIVLKSNCGRDVSRVIQSHLKVLKQINMLAFLFSQSDGNKNGYGDQCDGQGKDK